MNFFSRFKRKDSFQSNIDLLARIVEHTPLIIIVTDIEGKIRYLNSCAETTIGIQRRKLLDSSIWNHLSEYHDNISLKELFDKLKNNHRCIGVINLLKKDGAEIQCRTHAFNIINNENKPEAFVFILKDITQELLITSELEKKNIEMGKINSELIRSNEELKRVSELKSNFLSIASHELKTPLTTIKGFADIVIENYKDKIDPTVYGMVMNISKAGDRLHKIINDILDVTRIEQKRLRLKPESINICEIVCECINELSHFSAQRSIKFEFSCADNLPFFFGDRMRMHQVFTNLFVNAIKFSPDNSVVHIDIYLEDKENFHIKVTDQGIGIDRDEQQKIFDPFYEVGDLNRHSSNPNKFMGGGSGLGLTIVKGIVERHGGRIWVESSGTVAGKFPGSTFHIVIPCQAKIDIDDTDTKTINLPQSKHSVLESSYETVDVKPNILYIDNELEAIEVAKMILESAFNVLVAPTGELGLAMAFDNQPSLILLNTCLPGLDGYRICRILKTQDETRHIPIAFLSSDNQSHQIRKCFECGADDFIVKPFSGKELINKIWQLLLKKKEKGSYK